MSRFFIIIFLLGIFIELFVIIGILKDDYNPDGNIAIVELEGAIESSRETIKQLKKYEKSDSVKAIVFRVNSPGGVVGASQEIYDEVKRIQAEKPIVVSMGDMAASGGYYVSAPATKIVANAGTITGSLGVIISFPVIDEMLKNWNIRWEIIHAGENKAVGSPFEKMSPEERKILQDLVDDTHALFIGAVSEGRKIDEEKVRAFADGRIFSGKRAKELGLVDSLGSLEEAIRVAAELVKIKAKDLKPIYPRKEENWFDGALKGAMENVLTRHTFPKLEYTLSR